MEEPHGGVFAWYNVWVSTRESHIKKATRFVQGLGIPSTVQTVGKLTYLFIPWTRDAGDIHVQLIQYFKQKGVTDENTDAATD
jgi:hypothetical protein